MGLEPALPLPRLLEPPGVTCDAGKNFGFTFVGVKEVSQLLKSNSIWRLQCSESSHGPLEAFSSLFPW